MNGKWAAGGVAGGIRIRARVALHQVGQPGFVERDLAALQPLDP